MPLVHIERPVRGGSLRRRMFRLVPDLRSGLWDPEPRAWSGVGGAVLSPGAEADTFSFPPSATERLHGMRRSVVPHHIAAFKVVIVFADVREPPSLPPSLRYFLFVLVSSSPLHLLLHLFFLAGVVSVWTLLGLRSPLITDSSFLFCQQLPVTQPSGASSSADVLHKEAHKNICLPAQGISNRTEPLEEFSNVSCYP